MSEQASPWVAPHPEAIVVSIKPSKGHDSALIVFKGNTGAEISNKVIDFFGLDPFAFAEASHYEIFLEAQALAQGSTSAYTGLGARPVASGKPETQQAVSAPSSPAQPAPKPAPAAEAEPELTPEQALILKINEVTDKGALGRLWAENKALWTKPEVAAAAKAKGSSL